MLVLKSISRQDIRRAAVIFWPGRNYRMKLIWISPENTYIRCIPQNLIPYSCSKHQSNAIKWHFLLGGFVEICVILIFHRFIWLPLIFNILVSAYLGIPTYYCTPLYQYQLGWGLGWGSDKVNSHPASIQAEMISSLHIWHKDLQADPASGWILDKGGTLWTAWNKIF